MTRLIFEDCLGYVAEKKTPFAGLDLPPLDDEVCASAPPAAAEGRTEPDIGNGEFVPYFSVSMREPGKDVDRAMRMTLLMTGASGEGPLPDAGWFLVFAGPDWKPRSG